MTFLFERVSTAPILEAIGSAIEDAHSENGKVEIVCNGSKIFVRQLTRLSLRENSSSAREVSEWQLKQERTFYL